MEDEEVSNLLIEITEEFIKEENFDKLNEQKLATSIFYSFAVWILAQEDMLDEEKLINLSKTLVWLQENKKLIRNFGV